MIRVYKCKHSVYGICRKLGELMRVFLKGIMAFILFVSFLCGILLIFLSIISINAEFSDNPPGISSISGSFLIIFLGICVAFYSLKLIKWGGHTFDDSYRVIVRFIKSITTLPEEREKFFDKSFQEYYQRRSIKNKKSGSKN